MTSPGELLAGRYRLIDRIGAGGMAVIWRAHDETLDRLVAVKVLDLALSVDLVRREAWATARLNHPDVAGVHDFVHLGDFGVLVMQLVEGEPLADRIAVGPLPWTEAVRTALRVAQVLDHAHHRGVIHRDITPDNIVVNGERVTVLDFGIAARIGEPDDDSTGSSFGTPAYVAPERLDGTPAQTATDVYALGVVLFEMLTGRVPFRVRNWDDVANDHGPNPILRVPGMPATVSTLVDRMLSKDPASRPRAAEVAQLLRDSLTPNRSRLRLLVLTGALAAVTTAVVWWPSDPDLVTQEPPPFSATPSSAPPVSPSSPPSQPPRPSPSAASSPSSGTRSADQIRSDMAAAISHAVNIGEARPDAAQDLQQVLRNATRPVDLDNLRVKVTDREREGSISTALAQRLRADLDALALTMTA